MAYINDYSKEIAESVSGQVLSTPNQTKVIYLRGIYNDTCKFAKIERGDPVALVPVNDNLKHNRVYAGKVVAYDAAYGDNSIYAKLTSIVGVALATPKYKDFAVQDGEKCWVSDPVPVMVQGDVLATVI